MSWQGSAAPVWDAERLRTATDAAGVALWSWNVDTDEIALDERAHGLWDVPRGGPITFETLSARIHPQDVGRVRQTMQATRDMKGAYEIDFRILHGDDIRWISARGQSDDRGVVERVMFGVFLDVTDRKQAEVGREMLAVEMSHRIKNLFAVASALTSIAARSATTITEMARDLQQRLAALGRAHNCVQPASAEIEDREQLLGGLIAVLLAPYAEDRSGRNRVRVFVPDVRVGEGSVPAIALVVHELATNSVKYGALSAPDGTLDISGYLRGDDVDVVWTELGGPPVAASRGPAGFGSKLIAQSMAGKLGGSIAYEWNPAGLVVTLRMSKDRLTG